MEKVGGGAARQILVWSYERGTLQYDIICALILAFVFFVPRSCFIRRPAGIQSVSAPPASSVPVSAPAEAQKSRN
jgi:hypothetical protein